MKRLSPLFIAAIVGVALAAGGCKKTSNVDSNDKPAGAKTAPEADQPTKTADKPAEPPAPEMTMPAVGDAAPAFKTVAQDGTEVDTAALKGEPFVLYFYPRDETPG